jgi:endo-1,4-beta-xylanase
VCSQVKEVAPFDIYIYLAKTYFMKNILFGLLIGMTHIAFGQAPFLKDHFPFPVGASLNPRLLSANELYRNRAITEFNSVTAENHMKMMLVHPEANRFDFSKGDEIVQIAKSNQKRIHGHTLVWHNQVPKWMTEFTGDTQAWENLLKNHIQEVVKHYRGQVAGWDVVNEAFLDDGTMRPSIWSKNIPDYIAKSFQWAHEADPNAILFYNDYGQDGKPQKMEAILNMVKDLQARRMPIHGFGLQMHINVNSKNDELTSVINQSLATVLAIHFSELDIAVNPKNDSSFVYNETAQEAQKRTYEFVFQSYMRIPKKQQYGITFWNVGDQDSWLRGYFKRPKEYPLLFDDNYNRKSVYFYLLKIKHEK